MEEQKKAAFSSRRLRIALVAAGLILGILLGNALILLWEGELFLEKLAPQEINAEEVHSFTLCQMLEGRTILKEQRYQLSTDVRFLEVLDSLGELECEKTEQKRNGESYHLELLKEDGKVLHSLAFYENIIKINGVTYEVARSEPYYVLMFLFQDILHPGEYPAATFGEEVAQEPDVLEDVTMEVTYITYEGACAILRNDDDRAYEYGAEYSVEAYRDGKWHTIKHLPTSTGFALVAYTLEEGEETYMVAEWSDYYGILPAGRYRIRKGITDISSGEDYSIAVEFSIPENKNSILFR